MPDEAFWLKNKQDKCLQLGSISSSYIIGKICTVPPTLDMLWIRTTVNKQLMNVKTLRCMTINEQNGRKISLELCWSDDEDEQNTNCTQHKNGMKIGWWYYECFPPMSEYCVRVLGVLHLPSFTEHESAYAIYTLMGNQRWKGNQTSCIATTTYEGMLQVFKIIAEKVIGLV